MLDGFTFAPIQSAVMGAMIALTDVLLRPGLGDKGGLEKFFLYTAQTFILLIVFNVQGGTSPLCNIGNSSSYKMGDKSFGRTLMKVGFGTMILFISDALLRPEHVENMWIQFIKFLIQGSLMWHIFNHDFAVSV